MRVVFAGHERLASARLGFRTATLRMLLAVASVGLGGCDEAIVGSVGTEKVCTPSELRCTGDELAQRCDSDGQWATIEACTFRCVEGACVSECDPGETLCQGSVFRTCTPQGRWSDVLCPTGCTSSGCGAGAPVDVDGGMSLDDGAWRASPPGETDRRAVLVAPAFAIVRSRRRSRRAPRRRAGLRRTRRSGARAAACAAALLFAADARVARADEPGPHRLHTELGAGVVVLDRDTRDGWGGHAAIGYEYLVAGVLGFEGHFDAVLIPYDRDNFAGSGVAGYEALGVGPRLHLAPRARAVDPWLGGAVNGVRTGGLYRVGVSADLGVQFALTPTLALGPVARYAHVFQPNDDPRGGEDGQLVELALALRWAAPRRERAPEEEAPEPTPEATEPTPVREPEPTPTPTPARPTQARPEPRRVPPRPETGPTTPRIRQRIEFASESARIEPTEEAKLFEVRDALAQDARLRRVRIVGHADETGPAGFNQRLSEQRARAVARWLVRHGIRRSRLEVVGAGSSRPRAAGMSDAARQENRRVEIEVIDFDPEATPAARAR